MALVTAQAEVNDLLAEVRPQGSWDDGDYLWLTDHVEFTDGYLEVLPMPSREHQRIVAVTTPKRIPEYWIVEPGTESITVLIGGTYVQRGVFHRHAHATSEMLDGFGVAVDDVLRAAERA